MDLTKYRKFDIFISIIIKLPLFIVNCKMNPEFRCVNIKQVTKNFIGFLAWLLIISEFYSNESIKNKYKIQNINDLVKILDG